ncbi:MAG TPA: PIN domain-containing protein [Chloroflexota bacterium]
MSVIAIVDAGPLYAWADESDKHHDRCHAVLARADLRFIIPTLVVTEATYFVGRNLGAHAEADFLRALAQFEIEAPLLREWARMADLCVQYADFPLGGTDASVVALAERLNTDVIVTVDRRHFGAVRPRHVAAFQLLPD